MGSPVHGWVLTDPTPVELYTRGAFGHYAPGRGTRFASDQNHFLIRSVDIVPGLLSWLPEYCSETTFINAHNGDEFSIQIMTPILLRVTIFSGPSR